MSFGITDTGFVPKTQADIKAELQDAYKAIYGSPNLADDSVIGQRIALEAQALALAWEGLQLAYNAPFPSLTDEGSIDTVMDINGLTRLAATKTVINCTCTFTGATTITAGKLISNSDGSLFSAIADIVSSGAGDVDGQFECTESGPVACPEGDVLTIINSVANWSAVASTTPYNVTIGTDQESLAAARLRRQNSLLIIGAGTPESIRAAILNNVSGVTECFVIENNTQNIVDDLLPHSIHVICTSATHVDAAQNLAIATQIWQKRSGGIDMNGDVSVSVTGSDGFAHTIKFSYSEDVAIAVCISYSLFTEETPPTDIHSALTAALQDIFAQQSIGQDVLFGRVLGACYTVSGIKNIALTLDMVSSDVVVEPYQRAILGVITWGS